MCSIAGDLGSAWETKSESESSLELESSDSAPSAETGSPVPSKRDSILSSDSIALAVISSSSVSAASFSSDLGSAKRSPIMFIMSSYCPNHRKFLLVILREKSVDLQHINSALKSHYSKPTFPTLSHSSCVATTLPVLSSHLNPFEDFKILRTSLNIYLNR